jgi:hypothetical protein
MTNESPTTDWLSGYASTKYQWKHTTSSLGRRSWTRPMGVVESLFDVDGTDYEGRADLNVDLHISIRTSLTEAELRRHIIKAWSVLRQQHPLLSVQRATDEINGESLFAYHKASSTQQLVDLGGSHITFVADHYPDVNPKDFYWHLMNASRVIDASIAMSKLFVLPFEYSNRSPFTVEFMLVAAHQIADGLTVYRWMGCLIELLNLATTDLDAKCTELSSQSFRPSLPLPQEALYHPIKGSLARQRWFWAIARVLRHVKRPHPPAFPNPLRRAGPPVQSRALSPKYGRVLSYDRVPPLVNCTVQPTIGPGSTARLLALCRQAKISIGSGLFALVAIVMMYFEEQRDPKTPWEQRHSFVAGFPVNPRPFLAGTPTMGREDSLMLAFSDGITLPFLPSHLPLDGRFRLLGKQANRQLRQYQKRKRTTTEELSLGSHSPSQLLPSLFLSTTERLEERRQPGQRKGWNVQGAFPASVAPTPATCGISSVGNRATIISPGKYDTSAIPQNASVVADFRDMQSAVRPRNDEFLCGAGSDIENTYFMVSIDGSSIDMDGVAEFQRAIEHILEDGLAPDRPKL